MYRELIERACSDFMHTYNQFNATAPHISVVFKEYTARTDYGMVDRLKIYIDNEVIASQSAAYMLGDGEHAKIAAKLRAIKTLSRDVTRFGISGLWEDYKRSKQRSYSPSGYDYLNQKHGLTTI